MERKALIIGCPDDKIKGVYDDMKNYRIFMESQAGGGWYSAEIVTLESPDKATVQLQLEKLKKADYSMVVFAGHGEYSVVDRQTVLQLRPNVKISEHELKQGAPMRTVILDTCRVFSRATIREQVVKGSITMDSIPNLRSARVIFDEHLKKCPPGIAVMYGCGLNESAGDIPGEGGRYSSSLLQASGNWNLRSPDGRALVLSISEAHDLAVEVVKLTSGGTQNPKGEFLRALPRYPFAVTP